MRRSKIRQFVPRISPAFSIALIISSLLLSKSSFFDLHHRKRIGLVGLSIRSHVLLKISDTLCMRLTRYTHCHPYCCWRHFAISVLADVIFQVATNVICWRHRPISLLTSFVDRWLWPGLAVDFLAELTFCSLGAPYPVFCIYFIFVVHFCIFFF